MTDASVIFFGKRKFALAILFGLAGVVFLLPGAARAQAAALLGTGKSAGPDLGSAEVPLSGVLAKQSLRFADHRGLDGDGGPAFRGNGAAGPKGVAVRAARLARPEGAGLSGAGIVSALGARPGLGHARYECLAEPGASGALAVAA